MTNVKNGSSIRELVQAANLQTGFDEIPTKLATSIVPVININPNDYRFSKAFPIASSLSNATSATVYTCAADKDTYLTAASMSMIKDVTSTATVIALNVIPYNESLVAAPIIRITGFTLTVQNECVTIAFPFPIKLKRGSNITLTSDTNVANVSARCSLIGYEVENNN